MELVLDQLQFKFALNIKSMKLKNYVIQNHIVIMECYLCWVIEDGGG